MPILVSICDPNQISSLREEYREEMQCQIIHDSIHERPGWRVEYVLEIDGDSIGYGSVAIGGPWKTAPRSTSFMSNEIVGSRSSTCSQRYAQSVK
jgi:hypothetical protein